MSVTFPHAVLPLPHLHSATVAVALRGGPRFEGTNDRGLTHFLEHMVFRGAGELQSGALMAAFEEAGGEPEAYTSEDALMLLLEVDPGKLPRALELLAQVLLHPRFEDLEAERALILEERLEHVDEDGHPDDLNDLALALAFPGHPLGRSILGRKRDVLAHGLDDLIRWRERSVLTGNIAVAISGRVDAAQADAALEPLRAIPPGPSLAEEVPLEPQEALRTAFHYAEGTQTELSFSFRGPGENDPAFPQLRVLKDLLDGGPTSRLPRRLVDEGLAYDAQAELLSFPDVSLLGVELAIGTGKMLAAIDALLDLLDGLASEVREEELSRAGLRRRHRARQLADDPRRCAEWAARRLLYGLPTDHREVARREADVDGAEVQAMARRVLRPELLSLVVLGRGAKKREKVRRALRHWQPPKVD